MRFDEALHHHHLYEELRKEDRENTGKMTFYDKFVMRDGTHPRDIHVLQVDVPISRRVENLIRKIGQNPNMVTYGELRRSTVKVVCGLCRPEVATRMNFGYAVRHRCAVFGSFCIVDVRLLPVQTLYQHSSREQ